MAFPVTLNGRTYTLADFAGQNYVDGLPDAFEDFVTHAGDIYNDTSTSSVEIGTGSKSFTTASTNKPYQAGTPLRIADAAAPSTNYLDCIVTSYNPTTRALVVDAIGVAGSGTKSSWTINIGAAKTVDGTLGVNQGGTGATTVADARTALDIYSKTEADSRFLNVSGEASDVTMTGNVTIGGVGEGDTLTVNALPTFAENAGFSNDVDVTGEVSAGSLTVNGEMQVVLDGGGTNPSLYKAQDTSGGVALSQRRSRGTIASPTSLQDGDVVGGVNGLAHDGTSYVNTAGFRFKIDGTVSTGVVPQKMVFETSETNSLIERLVVKPNGDITFNNSAGTSQDFYWNATTSRLGLGVTPSALLHLGTSGPQIQFDDTDATGICQIYQTAGTFSFQADPGGVDANSKFQFAVDGTNKFQIDDGKVIAFCGSEMEHTAITSSSNAATIDLDNGDSFTHDLTENVTYTFSNPAPSGRATAFILKVIQDATARTITWPTSVDWAGGIAPTLSTGANDVDVFVFYTNDGGTTYYGSVVGLDFA